MEKSAEKTKKTGTLKWGVIISSVIYIILGVVLIAFPTTSMDVLCYIGGGAAIAIGIFFTISYFFRNPETSYFRDDLVIGVLAIMSGLVLVFKTDMVQTLVPILFGVFVTISGCRKLQDSVDLKRMGVEKWWVLLIVALVNIGLGVLLFFEPFAAELLLILIGVGLVFSGLTDLIVTFILSNKYKHFMSATAQSADPQPQSPQPADPVGGEAGGWTCQCGQTGNTGSFCESCGAARP